MALVSDYKVQYLPQPKCLEAYCTIDPTAVVATDFPDYWAYKHTDIIVSWSGMTGTISVDVTLKVQKKVTVGSYVSPWVDITGVAYNITTESGTAHITLPEVGCTDLRVTASVADGTAGTIEVYLVAKTW
jgi:hypothetical protein